MYPAPRGNSYWHFPLAWLANHCPIGDNQPPPVLQSPLTNGHKCYLRHGSKYNLTYNLTYAQPSPMNSASPDGMMFAGIDVLNP